MPYQCGQRVAFRSSRKKNAPLESGEILEIDDEMFTVQLDDEYCEDEDDDGLRECIPVSMIVRLLT